MMLAHNSHTLTIKKETHKKESLTNKKEPLTKKEKLFTD